MLFAKLLLTNLPVKETEKTEEIFDYIRISLIFCVLFYLNNYLKHIKFDAISFITWQNKLELFMVIVMTILACYLFYNGRKYLPGNLTDTNIKNDEPGLEFVRILIWQLYLVSYTF